MRQPGFASFMPSGTALPLEEVRLGRQEISRRSTPLRCVSGKSLRDMPSLAAFASENEKGFWRDTPRLGLGGTPGK